jgi:hypothetical protein
MSKPYVALASLPDPDERPPLCLLKLDALLQHPFPRA